MSVASYSAEGKATINSLTQSKLGQVVACHLRGCKNSNSQAPWMQRLLFKRRLLCKTLLPYTNRLLNKPMNGMDFKTHLGAF